MYILKSHLFLWWKSEFSASLLQSSVSHDPSEIILICWFGAQKNIIIKAENLCGLLLKPWYMFLRFFDE